jgi:hypothetical protein
VITVGVKGAHEPRMAMKKKRAAKGLGSYPCKGGALQVGLGIQFRVSQQHSGNAGFQKGF